MKRIPLILVSAIACVTAPVLEAQLTWDPAANGSLSGGAGTWNTTTKNWWNGTYDTNWLNTGATPAIFGGAGGTVTLATGANLKVGNLTLNNGVTNDTLECATTGQGLTIPTGGATWTLNTNTLTVFQNGTLDTLINMSPGDTLAVTGSGTFNAGTSPAATNVWGVGGSTLSVQGTLTLAANNASVGAFGTVKMAAGTTFYHQRNTSQTYTNNWNLGGSVTFTSNTGGGGRDVTLGGVISGSGPLVVTPIGATSDTNYFQLTNSANSFTGGVMVQNGGRLNVLTVAGDGGFGAVPGSPVANYIQLTNGGILWMNGVAINANRGITLENGGTIVNANSANSYGGQITGTGGLQIGLPNTADANTLILSGMNNYSNNTAIVAGSITLGANNTLPTNTVITIGGGTGTTSSLFLNGFSQTVGGLNGTGSNTRQVINSTAASPGTPGTLTLNPASNQSYSYVGTVGGSISSDAGNFNIVNNGVGTQILGSKTVISGTVTVNAGTLQIGNGANNAMQTGAATVNAGTLIIDNSPLTIPSITVHDGGALSLQLGTYLPTLSAGTVALADGANTFDVNYGTVSTNPTAAALNVTTPNGFTASATNITVNLSAIGLTIGQFPLLSYSGTPLASITNFNLVTPQGMTASLSNNVANSSVDVVVSSSVRLVTWYGDGGTDGIANWDLTSSNWNNGAAVYTNLYAALGYGDAVLFNSSFDGNSTNVALAASLTPESVIVSGHAYTFTGLGALSGGMSLTLNGAGTSLVLANIGENDYSGGTFLEQGMLALGVANALPTNGLFTLGSASASAYLYLDGFNQTLGGLVGNFTGPGNSRHVRNGSLNPAILTLNVSGTNNDVFLNTLGDGTFTTSTNNNFSLVKIGSGSQALRICSYFGTTTINGGSLFFNGDATAATNLVTVNNGATLGGNGSLGGAVTINNGATLAPAYNGISSLVISNDLSLAGNTLMEVSLDDGITNDQVTVSGMVNYGGTLTVTNVGMTALTNGAAFQLFNANGFTGTFTGISPTTAPGAGLAWNFDPTNGVLSVVSGYVPSTNAYLASLMVSNNLGAAVSLTPVFTTNGYVYYATNTLPANAVNVTVTDADLTATNTLFVNGNSQGLLSSGTTSATLALNAGSNNVTVQVVSQDLSTTNNYDVTVFDQPSLTAPRVTNSVSNGTLSLSWDANHLGYRLLMQTNNQSKGISTNAADWGTVAGSTGVTFQNITIPKASPTNEFYQLVYP